LPDTNHDSFGSLEDSLRAVGDASARSIAHDDQCEWVRSHFGIIGIVRIGTYDRAADVSKVIESAIAHAYSQLDGLAPDILTHDDLWNLLLLLALPWTRTEVASSSTELRQTLHACAGDVRGSRKLLLWANSSPADPFRELATDGAPEAFEALNDPIADELRSLAIDADEATALQLLLKRRIPDTDLDVLISALGRGTD
jgi:hypothetical protein